MVEKHAKFFASENAESVSADVIGGRILLGDNTGCGRANAATGLVPTYQDFLPCIKM